MKKSFRILALIAGFLITASVAFYAGKTTTVPVEKRIVDNEMTEMRGGGYTFINPLLECDNFHPSKMLTHEQLNEKLKIFVNQSYSSGASTHISVYFRALNSGPWVGINEWHNYSPASLLKVPIMIAILKKAESTPGLLNKEIAYNKKLDTDFVQNIKDTLIQLGQKYTVEELINRMIKFSDNEAKELLIIEAGDKFIEKVAEDLGMSFAGAQHSDDFVSVKTYSSFFRILYNATYLNRDLSEKALTILSYSSYDKGIQSGLPPGTLLSHKFGERGYRDSDMKQLHDCGIVYLENNPYLICIMTKGNDFEKLATVIADISSLVYKHVTRS